MASQVIQQALSIEQRVGHWTRDKIVDLNKIHQLLQLKLTLAKQNTKRVDTLPRHIDSTFDWTILREEVLSVTERLAFDVESIYNFGYQYLSGNSVLKAESYESVYLDIKISMNRLETSYLLAALWVGAQDWNANGKLLTAMFWIVKNARLLITKLTPNSDYGEQDGNAKKTFQNLVGMIMAKLRMFQSASDPLAKSIKAGATRFVTSVNDSLDVIEQIDQSLNTTNNFKTASEVALVLHLYEGFNHVRFDKDALKNGYKFTPGRSSMYLASRDSTGPQNPLGPIFTSSSTLNRISLGNKDVICIDSGKEFIKERCSVVHLRI